MRMLYVIGVCLPVLIGIAGVVLVLLFKCRKLTFRLGEIEVVHQPKATLDFYRRFIAGRTRQDEQNGRMNR